MRILKFPAVTLLLAGTLLLAQTTPPIVPEGTGTRERAASKTTDTDATFGTVKELTAGQKVVIAVDNAPDKTFDLADKDVKVKMAKGLKVGDPVKVVEQERMGKTHAVQISKHSAAKTSHEAPKTP